MAVYLNTKSNLLLYEELKRGEYFVDKSSIIGKISRRIKTNTKYLCVTKPRRFGKTSILNMLGAYYGKAYDSKKVFDGLKVSEGRDYQEHLNRYNVINLCLNSLPEDGNTFGHYIGLIRETLKDDLKEAYPELKDRKFRKLSDMLAATKDEFIFVIDEWDYIFSHELYPDSQGDFLEFLRDLLKDKSYVALVYMTGVLPIKKYSTGSALNMFKEYTMLNDPFFEEYFGFTEEEVELLCKRQENLTMDDIREWYNGYRMKDGGNIYNPRSVVCALEDGYCQSYWTRTGKMDEVLFFLKYNIGEVREDVVKMVNHMSVAIEIKKAYFAGQGNPFSKKDIFSAMIIYGLLSYSDGKLKIPNKELMLEFENALEDEAFGYVSQLVKNSAAVLDATLDMRGDLVASLLHDIHNSELPILKYNDENSLSCVVTLAYLSARDKYRIEREEKSGKGYADFIFYPRRKNLPGIILELKSDSSPEDAIFQIKEKEYAQKLRAEHMENILAVGISYDSGEKEHQCLIEKLSEKR